MKKIFLIVVVLCIILCGLQASAYGDIVTTTEFGDWGQKSTYQTVSYGGEVLDQYQIYNGTFGPIGVFPMLPNKNVTITQSFVPQKEMLTRIELQIGKNSTTTYPFMLAIRDELTAESLGVSIVAAEDILTENFSWISFSFTNLKLTTGQTYWMVAYTANVSDNFYGWTANDTNPYPNGSVAISMNDGQTWQNETTVDMTFKTYGMDATELELELFGGIGVEYSIKNVGLVDTLGVQIYLKITGGILNLINITEDGVFISPLAPNASIDGAVIPLGLGPMAVTMIVRAANAMEVTKNFDAVILFFFVILK